MRQYIKNVTFKTFQIGLLSIRYSLFSLYLGMPCAHETHISVMPRQKVTESHMTKTSSQFPNPHKFLICYSELFKI